MSYFAPYIDETGLHMPTYEDRLADLSSSYRSIFGIEAELSDAVPDYQLLSIFAKALDDVSALVLQAVNNLNPAYASGAVLDLHLPLYGLTRAAGETDAAVRTRIKTALAARSADTMDAILAAVKSVQYVRAAKVYVNDTDETDSRGITAHSVALVVSGGLSDPVAQALFDKKAPGISTYGPDSGTATDTNGVTHTVNFTRTQIVATYIYLVVRALDGCDQAAVTAAIQSAVLSYANGLDIAEDLIIPRLYAIAYMADPSLASTFAVADAYATVAGQQGSTRDQVSTAWNQKISVLASGGVTVTFQT